MNALHTVSASTICGTNVENAKGDELGKIEDVMIDPSNGSVAYLVLSYGGVFGTTLADKRFAVPFDAFRIKHDDDEVEYLLNVEKDFLEKAPGFNKKDYPDFADSAFRSTVNTYYDTLNRPRRAA